MNNRYMILSMVVGFSVFLAGCASTPKDNQMVDEAKAAYEDIRTDPDVARSGDRQLRSARDQLARAERLLEEGASTAEIEHAAYLANRHAEIAREQAERATFLIRSGTVRLPSRKPLKCAVKWRLCRPNRQTVAWYLPSVTFCST